MEKNFLNIIAQNDKNAEIDIFGYIGFDWLKKEEDQNTKENFKKKLNTIKELNVENIIVNISSFGGCCDDAIAIYDILKEHSAKITTKISGYVASAATIIAMAGDNILMSDNSLFLIHKCRSHICGNENEIEQELKSQKQINAQMAKIYVNACRKRKEDVLTKEIEALMNENNGNGIWLNAEAAMKLGFVDDIYNINEKVAYIDEKTFATMALPTLPEGYVLTEPINPKVSTLDKIKTYLNLNNNPKKQPKMEKFNFNKINEVLNLENVEYNAEKGYTFDKEQLQMLENELTKNTDTLNEIETLKKEIETISQERNDWKDKYENSPIEPLAHNKIETEDFIDVTNDETYKQLAKFI